MNLYTFYFKGSWLGGRAVVVAPDPCTARTLVTRHPTYMMHAAREEQDLEITDVAVCEPGVAYIYDGEY